jgi:hypothetical protein
MKVEFTFKSYSCLDAYIHWTVSGVDSIGRYMSFPSFLWSGGASLGRAFLSKTAKPRRRRLIFARRDPVALCFCLPVLFCSVLFCFSFSCASPTSFHFSCVPDPMSFNRQSLAWRVPLWAVKANAGQLKYSCHTVHTPSRRQTASLSL